MRHILYHYGMKSEVSCKSHHIHKTQLLAWWLRKQEVCAELQPVPDLEVPRSCLRTLYLCFAECLGCHRRVHTLFKHKWVRVCNIGSGVMVLWLENIGSYRMRISMRNIQYQLHEKHNKSLMLFRLHLAVSVGDKLLPFNITAVWCSFYFLPTHCMFLWGRKGVGRMQNLLLPSVLSHFGCRPDPIGPHGAEDQWAHSVLGLLCAQHPTAAGDQQEERGMESCISSLM